STGTVSPWPQVTRTIRPSHVLWMISPSPTKARWEGGVIASAGSNQFIAAALPRVPGARARVGCGLAGADRGGAGVGVGVVSAPGARAGRNVTGGGVAAHGVTACTSSLAALARRSA